jgi:hypothetical protein
METAGRNRAIRLKASVGRASGIQEVDLFVDHTPENGAINIGFANNAPISLSDHLKLILMPFSCPDCRSQSVTSNYGWSLKQWFLKFFGRKIFRCTDCGAKQVVKVRRCQWETIATVIAITVTLLATSIYWALR